MVRNVAPLLVEHRALPLPLPDGSGAQAPSGESRALHSLKRGDRLRCALQLTAAAAVLADFDLWPGLRAIRNARAVVRQAGVQVWMPWFPVSLTEVSRRLGGGENAALVLRDGLVEAVTETTRISSPGAVEDAEAPGFFLGPFISGLVHALPSPLDEVTAANLWAVRWHPLSLPDEGEVQYWTVPRAETALRLGAALAVSTRRSGELAVCRELHAEGGDTAPRPALGMEGTLVLTGHATEGDIAALAGWVRGTGRRAVVLGTFPRGWEPPEPPGFDASRLAGHLALAGCSAEHAESELQRRRGRFHPLRPQDRQSLTESARRLFAVPDEGPLRQLSRLEELLGLLPEGLPEGFLAVHLGVSAEVLRRQAAHLPVVEVNRSWRLANPGTMRRDALHEEVASLFSDDDPRRIRHAALATGEVSALLAWARDAINELHGERVRELLADVAAGELGDEVQCVLADACLSELDLAGTRRAVEGLAAELRGPWKEWMNTVDRPRDEPMKAGSAMSCGVGSRARAELAMLRFRRAVRSASPQVASATEALDSALGSIDGPLSRWFEIERAAVERPELLTDRGWRGRVVDGHPKLARLLCHKRAMQLRDQGKLRGAQLLLTMIAAVEAAPGRRGMIHFDLGGIEAARGHGRSGELHNLWSFGCLQAAGFRHRTRDVIFNLAVSDLDQLNVRRAERRLQAAGHRDDDLFVLAEQARLCLAIGDEAALRDCLDVAPEGDELRDPRFAEAFSLLSGVVALLNGNLRAARVALERGGDEARAWLDLAAAIGGQDRTVACDDPWGVAKAAQVVRAVLHAGPDEALAGLAEPEDLRLDNALAVALVERLLGRQTWLPASLRARCVQRLQTAGISGWARSLSSASADGGGFVAAMAELLERGRPADLDDDAIAGVLEALAVTGIEVKAASDGLTVWRCGSGDPCAAMQHGRYLLIPLGADIAPGPHLDLFSGLLDLVLPRSTAAADEEVALTGIHGQSAAVRRHRAELRRLATSMASVVLLGETGSGKELAARALHDLSDRKGRFVPVNVAGIPDALLEAELFGSVKGAYTGADRSRRGLVDAADGGTLFFDEIGDLGLPLQVKLLRFLESGEVRPLGADHAHQVDVRIVSATHRDLKKRRRNGTFREDLFFRICSIPAHVPTLRERKEDIPLLRDLFAEEVASRDRLEQCRWSRDADAALLKHRWPGNVRELHRAVEFAMLRAGGRTVTPEDLPFHAADGLPSGTWEEAMTEFRRRFLVAALERNAGNRSATARELGISRQTLLYHIRNLAL